MTRPVRPKMASIEGVSVVDAEAACKVLGFKTMRLPDNRQHACIAEAAAAPIIYLMNDLAFASRLTLPEVARQLVRKKTVMRAYNAAVALAGPDSRGEMAALILLPKLKRKR